MSAVSLLVLGLDLYTLRYYLADEAATLPCVSVVAFFLLTMLCLFVVFFCLACLVLYCRQNKDKHFNEDVNDIMIIPDLDEDGGGDSDARGELGKGKKRRMCLCLCPCL